MAIFKRSKNEKKHLDLNLCGWTNVIMLSYPVKSFVFTQLHLKKFGEMICSISRSQFHLKENLMMKVKSFKKQTL